MIRFGKPPTPYLGEPFFVPEPNQVAALVIQDKVAAAAGVRTLAHRGLGQLFENYLFSVLRFLHPFLKLAVLKLVFRGSL